MPPLQKHTQSELERFDEWRNDGEHASLDDGALYKLDIVMLKGFIFSSIEKTRIETIREVMEILNTRKYPDTQNIGVIADIISELSALIK